MAGSSFGTLFQITTWGESHGKALGVVIDGCPAGLPLCEEDIQHYLNRRKPGQSSITTQRKEGDLVEILSGIFEGQTTGTPISLMVRNTSQLSSDYEELASCYRPGHADYSFDSKYGFRDYRGGGRSSGRETIGRVAAGSIAIKLLKHLGIDVFAFTRSIGSIEIDESRFDRASIYSTITAMPDQTASAEAESFLQTCIQNHDSAGGVIECRVSNLPAGIGQPVFDKLDANLSKALFSIGAVKAVEVGAGCSSATMLGSQNNDAFIKTEHCITKKTNHAGGILGGISDGDTIILRAYVKPTPSIYSEQDTVNKSGEPIKLKIKGRHDPIIVPRAVVVAESMVALTLIDQLFINMSSKLENITNFYQ